MQFVRSIKTTDGTLFAPENEKDAIAHEASISMLGVMNRNSLGSMTGIQPRHVAKFIIEHADEITAELRKFRERMGRAKKRLTKV